ncbi:mechanosensitive ion channel family protein [Sulfolobus acidocaldarius]|uniref:Conserved Crenarchaeal protein n=4 Tax=Sulfolobus acidocaldarius TaxID=2285 RepID=Q4JCP6_SULAC|nr:hypothetical protein [Sulfolobus acidocaldarius]AAY79433.1 conserved Crenarchaeal protein [Sulfolobus acidocaldarius DSM 639]AGE69984.1 hypothetical protein SacN8_00015 [Sulfolobus acidocaldarius N8]AGE72259.1 hypothetical protein SacRon12I_00015 [Sulfolobus acidocaldarius Ron12/I]ALU29581.1 hypothetical protein ATY89_06230 [Sulfolobus acidocaldarius]ALU32312.1 hypothetical protein ATZ20_09255 [Sulfolobus acidocaldarius]
MLENLLFSIIIYQATSISEALSNLATEIINAIPSIILFVIIVIIGYIVADIVASIVGRVLRSLVSSSTIHISANLVSGTVKALIIIISLAIAFSILNLGPANTYISAIATYLPYLAGAILLLTLGITLINILLDYISAQIKVDDPFAASIFSVLRLGLYAVIITVAATLAIFQWIPFISAYLFYDILIGFLVLLFSFVIIDKAMENISKSDPNATYITTYGRFILYAIFILVAVAIIIQPFSNVTSIIQILAWGLAIGFGILLIPLIYAMAKKLASEFK